MRAGAATLFAMLLCAGTALADERDDAITMFRAVFGTQCPGDAFGGAGVPEPEVYRLVFKSASDGLSAKPRELRLYRFLCAQGAYSASYAFFSATEADGLQPVYFPQPTYQVIYDDADGEPEEGTKVVRIQLTGIAGYATLSNPEVDPVSGTIVSMAYWRGLGDASSSGEWRLVDGVFTLVRFDVDASYDGEVNPVRIVNYMGVGNVR